MKPRWSSDVKRVASMDAGGKYVVDSSGKAYLAKEVLPVPRIDEKAF